MMPHPIDPFANQKTCAKCKFYQFTPPEPGSPDGRVDYTLYACTQPTPHVLCYDYRREGAACGPAGTLWVAAT